MVTKMKKILLQCVILGLLLMLPAQADVIIHEICASNGCIYYTQDGESPDWVELHNTGDETVDLTGWALADNLSGKNLHALDGVELPPQGYAVITLGEKFSLSADGEAVHLFKDGQVMDSVHYEGHAKNKSVIRLSDGTFAETDLPTPGMANITSDEANKYPLMDIYFSEVLTSAAPLKNLSRPDYFELYNDGTKTFNLKGYTVKLGMSDYYSYTFGKEYIYYKDYTGVYCTDMTTQNLNTGFNLPAENTVLTLWNKEGELIDFFRVDQMYGNASCSRDLSTGEMKYHETHTLGKKNSTAYAGKLTPPELTPGGRYEGSVTVTVTAQEGCEIHYTTNGNTPTKEDPVYSGALTITKDTALSVRAFKDGYIASEPACATYLFSLTEDLPVICLVIDNYYLYDKDDGMLASNGTTKINYYEDWEYPASFEYLDENGNTVIAQRCGMGVQGDSSRGNKQKSFQVIARKAYGSDTFAFNPFDNREFTEYRSFNIRGAGSEGLSSTRFRDAYLTSLAEGTNLLWCDSQPVLVYLNGELRGHYNLRERMNKYYVAQHEGIEDNDVIDQIDLLTELGNVVRSGSNKDYIALRNFMRLNDLNVQENLDYVLSQMDIDSYFDYICFCILTGNRDLSNSRFYRVHGGKWTWMINDLDRAMEKSDEKAAFNAYCRDINRESDYMSDHIPFQALMKVPAMREKFLARLSELQLSKFLPEQVLPGVDLWQEKLQPFMAYHIERWGDGTMHYWETQIDHMRKVINERQDYVVQYTVDKFKLTEDEKQLYFGEYLSRQ